MNCPAYSLNAGPEPRIRFRAYEKADLDAVIRWVNDEAVTQYLSEALLYPVSHAEELKWLESVSLSNPREKIFAIETVEGILIGSVGLVNIDWVGRKAELGIMIGEKGYWNRGLGTEAVREVLRIGFEKMNLNRVFLKVYDYNTRAIKVYERCGFRKEGVLRQDRFHARKYWDTHVMGILREEYLAAKPN